MFPFSAISVSPTVLTPPPLIPATSAVIDPIVASLLSMPLSSHPMHTFPTMSAMSPSIYYPNVNTDAKLRHRMLEYFWGALTENWLRYQFFDIYRMLRVNNGQVEVVGSSRQSGERDGQFDKQKYDFLTTHVIPKDTLEVLLDKFCETFAFNWWDLQKKERYVRKYVLSKMVRYLEKQAQRKST